MLAKAVDAWARWRLTGSGEPASSEERELLSALDRLAAAGGHSGRHLIVLCSACRRIRDDSRWIELETYITETIGIGFTHRMCTECMTRLYPNHAADPE